MFIFHFLKILLLNTMNSSSEQSSTIELYKRYETIVNVQMIHALHQVIDE
jgi:hypothetical protein